MTDQPINAPSQIEADFRQLRRFPRAGLAADDDHAVIANRSGDLVTPLTDRQDLVVLRNRLPVHPLFAPLARLRQLRLETGEVSVVRLLFATSRLHSLPHPAQPLPIDQHGPCQSLFNFRSVSHRQSSRVRLSLLSSGTGTAYSTRHTDIR